MGAYFNRVSTWSWGRVEVVLRPKLLQHAEIGVRQQVGEPDEVPRRQQARPRPPTPICHELFDSNARQLAFGGACLAISKVEHSFPGCGPLIGRAFGVLD
jgi:hypothetical protein